jgi:hypothetical protein
MPENTETMIKLVCAKNDVARKGRKEEWQRKWGTLVVLGLAQLW